MIKLLWPYFYGIGIKLRPTNLRWAKIPPPKLCWDKFRLGQTSSGTKIRGTKSRVSCFKRELCVYGSFTKTISVRNRGRGSFRVFIRKSDDIRKDFRNFVLAQFTPVEIWFSEFCSAEFCSRKFIFRNLVRLSISVDKITYGLNYWLLAHNCRRGHLQKISVVRIRKHELFLPGFPHRLMANSGMGRPTSAAGAPGGVGGPPTGAKGERPRRRDRTSPSREGR